MSVTRLVIEGTRLVHIIIFKKNKEMGWEDVDWIHLAQERGQIDGFMNTIMNLLVS
jgi:hypothetical protein